MRKFSKTASFILICTVQIFFTSKETNLFAQDYEGGRIGYYDAEHTKDDGSIRSEAGGYLQDAYIRGSSSRYNGTGLDLGMTVWSYDVSALTINKLGIYDGEHTRDDGYKYSQFLGSFVQDYMFGYSKRYNGGAADLGQTSWVYDAANKKQVVVGLYDGEHTRNDGYKFTEADASIYSGYVTGYSYRYLGGAAFLGKTQWLYSFDGNTQIEIGYYDGEHTKDDGYQGSSASLLSSEYVVGSSERYNGGAINLGYTAWLYSIGNSTYKNVGLYDVEHTSDIDYKRSDIWYSTESGYIYGYSKRYNGGAADLGKTAWVYDIAAGAQFEVGYYDAEHTKLGGYQNVEIDPLGSIQVMHTESGYVIGYSERYEGAGGGARGLTAWAYDIPNRRQIKLGLYDAEHTRNDDYKFSYSTNVYESGYVRGYSYRYNGGAADLGRTAWIYDIPNLTLHEVGLYDAEHTRNDGYQYSQAGHISQTGYVGVYSIRYNGGAAELGKTAFVYDIPNSVQVKVGFYDAEHTSDSGYQRSEVGGLSESGYVCGFSERYNGAATHLGFTAWIYDVPNSLQREVGFYDTEHTRSNGFQLSQANTPASSGYVIGFSKRYNNTATDLGETAWVYDIPNTILYKVGVYDFEHTKDSGYKYSYIDPSFVTESGYVGGYSTRYNGTAIDLGKTAWIYHVPTRTQKTFDFGEDIATGAGWSEIKFLQENGDVFGVFGHVDSAGNIDGERVFKGDLNSQIDLFEEVGGDILNYHFAKDSINIYTALLGDAVAGYGSLWNVYHPAGEFVSFVIIPKGSNVISDTATNNNQLSLAEAIDETGSYVGSYAVFMQYLLQYMSGDDASGVLQKMIPQASSFAKNVGVESARLIMGTIITNNLTTLSSINATISDMQAQLNENTSGVDDNNYVLHGKYIYSKGSQDGNLEHDGYDFDSNGIVFGVDTLHGDSGFVGAAIGFLTSDINGDNNSGDVEQTSFSPNIYLSLVKGKWNISTGVGYGFGKNESKRFSGINEVGTIEDKWDSHSGAIFGSGAYRFKESKDFAVDFVFGLDYMLTHNEGHTEKKDDLWNMQIDSSTTNSLRSKLGYSLKKNKAFKNGMTLKAEFHQFWLHDYLQENNSTVSSFNGSSSFEVRGLKLDKDRCQIGGVLELDLLNAFSVFLSYDTQLSENSTLHEINTGIKYNF